MKIKYVNNLKTYFKETINEVNGSLIIAPNSAYADFLRSTLFEFDNTFIAEILPMKVVLSKFHSLTDNEKIGGYEISKLTQASIEEVRKKDIGKNIPRYSKLIGDCVQAIAKCKSKGITPDGLFSVSETAFEKFISSVYYEYERRKNAKGFIDEYDINFKFYNTSVEYLRYNKVIIVKNMPFTDFETKAVKAMNDAGVSIEIVAYESFFDILKLPGIESSDGLFNSCGHSIDIIHDKSIYKTVEMCLFDIINSDDKARILVISNDNYYRDVFIEYAKKADLKLSFANKCSAVDNEYIRTVFDIAVAASNGDYPRAVLRYLCSKFAKMDDVAEKLKVLIANGKLSNCDDKEILLESLKEYDVISDEVMSYINDLELLLNCKIDEFIDKFESLFSIEEIDFLCSDAGKFHYAALKSIDCAKFVLTSIIGNLKFFIDSCRPSNNVIIWNEIVEILEMMRIIADHSFDGIVLAEGGNVAFEAFDRVYLLGFDRNSTIQSKDPFLLNPYSCPNFYNSGITNDNVEKYDVDVAFAESVLRCEAIKCVAVYSGEAYEYSQVLDAVSINKCDKSCEIRNELKRKKMSTESFDNSIISSEITKLSDVKKSNFLCKLYSAEKMRNDFKNGQNFVFGNKVKRDFITTTQLDEYMYCPFKYYMDDVVASSSYRKDDKSQSVLLGSIYHNCLEAYYTQKFDLINEAVVSNKALNVDANLIEELVDSEFSKESFEEFDDVNSVKKQIIKKLYDFISTDLQNNVDMQKLLHRFESSRTLDFNGMRIQGRIDRIDKYLNSNKYDILDYKLNSIPTKKSVETMERTQLLLYALMFGVDSVASLTYRSIRKLQSKAVLSEVSVDKKGLNDEKWLEFFINFQNYVSDCIKKMDNGVFTPRECTCDKYNYCAYRYACKFKKLVNEDDE